MRFRLAYRRYRLPLRVAVRTAHGVWREREGLIVRLENERGEVGFGEAAPLPWFGTETVEQAEEVCRRLGDAVDAERLAAAPDNVPCLQHALACAADDLATAEEAGGASAAEYLPIAALLPAGPASLGVIDERAESGFRVFKWKVGVGDVADELALLDDVCARLPEKSKLRLDANGAWDRRVAERWLKKCAERPIEFVEQPCLARSTDSPAAAKRADDVLRGLAEDFPTPIALDESLVRDGDVARWLEHGWSGIFVVKPALLARPVETLHRLSAARADVVFSSALETAVEARDGLRRAFAWRPVREGPPRALGYGVWPLFSDQRFDGPAAAPFVRRSDLDRINPEAVWNALN